MVLIERCISYLAQFVYITCWALMLVICYIVFSRAVFNQGSIALQDLTTYLHAAAFMLAIAYAWKNDKHIRVDIFYQRFSDTTKHWINSLGIIYLLFPFAVFVMVTGWDYFYASWQIKERAADPGGIDAVFVLKSLIPLLGLTLFLEGLVKLIYHCRVLTNTASIQVHSK